MTEQIGKITLDYSHYPGEDLYSDGAVEDELLDIVKRYPASEYRRVIEERGSWPVLYHLSPLRANIVDWVPLTKKDKVLEVGSGCGAITGMLSGKAGSVTCIELSKKRSYINAYRHTQCDNVTINVGNFQDIERSLDCDYDYIFLIGVFEYAHAYIGSDNPAGQFMSIMKRHMKENGHMVIAIENRWGLKYWAGCREDHYGTYFSGLEDYPEGGGVRTFTRRGLEEICRGCGLTEYSFYYPYPDYKFMTTLYSDRFLPRVGELSNNMRNFDRDRLLLFDEKNVFDSVIREEMFPIYSNSFALVTGSPFDVQYVKYSNDRADEFAVKTEIRGTKDGRVVVKSAMGTGSLEHIKRIGRAYEQLAGCYAGSRLAINHCEIRDGAAYLEYLEGSTLEELLDSCLDRGDEEGFRALVDQYIQMVNYSKGKGVCDYDLIFSNIIVQEDKWHLIDYEWTFDREVPVEKLTARALYCYGLGSEKRKKISLDLIQEKAGYSSQQIEELVEKEKSFQKYTTGSRMSMVEIRNEIGNPIVPSALLGHRYMEEQHKNRIQIYEDYGEGFREEDSYFLAVGYAQKEEQQVKLLLKPGVKAVRLDPAMDSCIVTVNGLWINGQEKELRSKEILLNGNLISENTIVFSDEDPNITLDLRGEASAASGETQVLVRMETVRISGQMAAGMMRQKKGKWFFGK